MTHTLHPEIENEIKNLFVEFANKHTDCQMFIDLVSKHLWPYLLPPSQHLKDEQFVEQFEKYCEEELKQSTPKIAQERKEKLIDFINTL